MRAKVDPRAWLEMHQYYGDLADNPTLAVAFACWLRLIWAEGVLAGDECLHRRQGRGSLMMLSLNTFCQIAQS